MENIERALVFAAKAHERQYRKQTDTPYITHPMSVALILQQEGCDETVVIAGLLHDVVEDSESSVEDIKREFGKKVADIVAACTEPDKGLDWKTRKQNLVNVYATAPIEVKLVACADKLHNLRTIRSDRVLVGEKVWRRFNSGKTSQEWYYRAVVKALCSGLKKKTIKNSIFEQLALTVEDVFGKQLEK